MKYSALLLCMMPVLVLQASEDSKSSVIVSIYRLHGPFTMYETTYHMYHVKGKSLDDVQQHIEKKFNVQGKGTIKVHNDNQIVTDITGKSKMDDLLQKYGTPCIIDFTISPFPRNFSLKDLLN
jgi:hypothetical protein